MSPQFCREQFKTPYFIECLCKHSNRINPGKNPPAEGSQQNIAFLFSDCMLSSQLPNNLFLYYLLILSKIDSKWFCLWGEEGGKKDEICHLRKGKKNHSSTFFKVPWQQNIQNFKFDENSRQREADYKGDNLLLLWREPRRLIAHTLSLPLSVSHTHTRTQRGTFFMWTAVKNHLFSALSRPFSRRTMGVRL